MLAEGEGSGSMNDHKDPEAELIFSARTRLVPRLSLDKAARRIGMSASRWSQIEKGAHAPPDTLAMMARALTITPDELRHVGRDDAADALEALTEQTGWQDADDPIIRMIRDSNYLDDDDRHRLIEMRRRQNQDALGVIDMLSDE